MKVNIAILFAGAAALACSAAAQSDLAQVPAQLASPAASIRSASPVTSSLPDIPPAPKGKSTILGGQIQRIDPVRDELTLKVYGQHPEKILFDERTQFFVDGKKLPLRNLAPAEHASVQTLLDGTNVFALSVHVLSQTPQGEYQGLVLGYNPATNQLAMSSVLFHEPLKLLVPPGTPVVRVGQKGFASEQSSNTDLARGSLVSVQFGSDNNGHGVASHISVLATPGAAFVFIGNIVSLDMHAGRMSIADAQEDRTYQVTFDPGSLPRTQTLRPGNNVMVTAEFSGDHYVASAITVNQ